MNQATNRKTSTWKVVGIVAAVAVTLLIVGIFSLRAMTESRWSRFERELKARVRAEMARERRRPILRGASTSGNAWDDYRIAIAEANKIVDPKKPGDTKKVIDLIARTPEADAAWGATALAQSSAALDPLQRGASRSNSNYGYDWEKGLPFCPVGSVEQHIVSLAILKARALGEEGKQRQAAAQLLDAAEFSRDVADDGVFGTAVLGMGMLHQALDGLRELSERADAKTLLDLERGLELLDAGFPKFGDALRRENLKMERDLVWGDPSLSMPGSAGSNFLQRFYALGTLGRVHEAMERTARASEGSWSDSQAEVQRVRAEMQKSWDPILKIMAPSMGSSEKDFRGLRAKLRLLRAAIHYRRTGEIPDLDDPFGGKLKSVKSGDSLKLWSVGADGVDDGGKGEWKAGTGPDIVLEVRK